MITLERAWPGPYMPPVPVAMPQGRELSPGRWQAREQQARDSVSWAADSLAPGPPPGALSLTSSGQSCGAQGAVWMVLVNTLSCAQPGRACGQREGEELAAPMAGQADGRADRRAGRRHSQAKAQNGAPAPVTMETETEQ